MNIKIYRMKLACKICISQSVLELYRKNLKKLDIQRFAVIILKLYNMSHDMTKPAK